MADKNHIRPFKKLLAANRSEIAIRIFRAGTELDLRTVAIYAQEDRFCLHRFKADEAYLVGEGKGPVAAYLDIESIVALAKEKGVDAIHPGYGFLSENAEFRPRLRRGGHHVCRTAPGAARHDGRQNRRPRARAKNQRPRPARQRRTHRRPRRGAEGREGNRFSAHHQGRVRRRRARHARRAQRRPTLPSLLDEAQVEAERAFGNPAVFLEKYIPRAKHIEVQILGDQHGNVHSSARARLLGAAPPSEGHRNRAQSVGLPNSVVRRNCARPPRAWPARSATTTPARLNFSTTSTSTNGSSSR